eukprot:g8164.t1
MREVALYTTFGVLFLITLGCMMCPRRNMPLSHAFAERLKTRYTINADPGLSRRTRNVSHDIEEGLPQRAHKSRQYDHPIRRYDHYCKWVNNVIGLLNHREFILMVGGRGLSLVVQYLTGAAQYERRLTSVAHVHPVD